MDALQKNIEENLCGKDINQTHFRKKKLCCNSKKIKAFWLLAQPKKMHFNRKSMQNQQKKGTRLLTLFLCYLGDQCQVQACRKRRYWGALVPPSSFWPKSWPYLNQGKDYAHHSTTSPPPWIFKPCDGPEVWWDFLISLNVQGYFDSLSPSFSN